MEEMVVVMTTFLFSNNIDFTYQKFLFYTKY